MSTISKGILAMLESGPKTISELYEGVPGKRASIDKARWRLVKSGEIESVDPGVYRKKPVLGARPLGNFSWKDLTDDAKIDYELNRIADVIEMCCDLIDRSADGQSLTILERIEALEGLFSSCSNFVESSSEELRALEAKWKAEGVDVDALYRESYPEKTPLKNMISFGSGGVELSERLSRLAKRVMWVMRSVTLASKVVAMAVGGTETRGLFPRGFRER